MDAAAEPRPGRPEGGGTTASPAFVACCARSGSTLLRWLLDAHPELSCPGETDIATLVSTYVRVATDLSQGAAGAESEAFARARAVADELMATGLAGTEKKRWCDKSLSNATYLELLASVWPDARFLLLHRHCMDFVMSGLEASPWGLSEYGFAPFAQHSPTDTVLALCAYWIERTQKMLAFERRFPERSLRIRYEDLVTSPEEVIGAICDFLGVARAPEIVSAAFEEPHSSRGAADHAIWYTREVHTDSIAHGARVPPERVREPLRAGMNELLTSLGYVAVDESWGSGAIAPLEAVRDAGGALAEVRILEGHELVERALVDLSVLDVVPGAAREAGEQAGDGVETVGAAFVVAVERSTLEQVVRGDVNFGSALRARTLRYYGPFPAPFRDERQVFERIEQFLAGDRSPFQTGRRALGG